MVFVLGIVLGVCVATPIVYVLTARYLSAPWPDALSLTGEHPYGHDAEGKPLFPAPVPFVDHCDCKGVAGDVGMCDRACRRPGGPREALGVQRGNPRMMGN